MPAPQNRRGGRVCARRLRLTALKLRGLSFAFPPVQAETAVDRSSTIDYLLGDPIRNVSRELGAAAGAHAHTPVCTCAA
jgi:hypothetical protein